jgi:hypothetical protein
MNTEKERELAALARRNPFWICLILFVVLGSDYGFRMANLFQQRQQLSQAQLMQTQNLGALAQAQQIERKLEGLSLELLQVARTNATANQIVRDFNIQWNPRRSAPNNPQRPPLKAEIQKNEPHFENYSIRLDFEPRGGIFCQRRQFRRG